MLDYDARPVDAPWLAAIDHCRQYSVQQKICPTFIEMHGVKETCVHDTHKLALSDVLAKYRWTQGSRPMQ